MSTAALRARGLSVRGATGETLVHPVDLDVRTGRILALVGPSGAGKTLTVRGLARLLPDGLTATGSVRLGDTDLLGLSPRQLRRLRGTALAWVGQDPTASLNPTITVGAHLTESLRAHDRSARTRQTARDQGVAGLAAVGLSDPERLWGAYPFELSGGQAQRVAFALATVADPSVVLADEVTAELDVVSGAEVMDLLRGQADAGRAVLVVTHDLLAATRWADDVVVMEAGRVVERGTSGQVLGAPTAPLTRAWAAVARPDVAPTGSSPARAVRHAASRTLRVAGPGPVGGSLSCRDLGRTLHGRGRSTQAIEGIDLDIEPGAAVAVVGRSGSGKSTLVGVLAALDRPDTGRLLVDGVDAWTVPAAERRAVRRRVGLVFQDALSSFDPRYTVGRVVAEALPGAGRHEVPDLLTRVGMDPALAARRPVTLSGGQRQRVAVARAIAAGPRVLLADEPTSGLDVLAQEHLLALLGEIRERHGLTVVVVTHDLTIARRVAERVIVLEHGRIAEDLPAAALDEARHPATRELLEAAPHRVLARSLGASELAR